MNHTQGAIVAVQFRQACAEFTFRDRRRIRSLTVVLELTAQSLVQSETIRAQAGADLKLWPDLRKLWRDLARTQLSFWDTYDSGDEDEDHDENEQDRGLCELCMNLAKFTRNLVAGVPANQLRAYENEPDIRRLLHFYTSWSAMEDPKAMATARALTQALSNMVTTNDTLVATLWESYLNLPEDQVVLIRLLGSPDAKTLLTTLVFILNCIHGSRKRAQLLVKTRVGVRISIGLLDNMVRLHEAEEGSDAAKAFDVGYTIFTQFVEAGMIPDLYKKFAVKGEIVTPHQTTLLKLVDSYLQSTQLGTASIQIPDILQTHESLGPFLAKRFFSLSEYAQAAIHRALGMDPTPRTTNRSDESATTSGSSDSISSSGPLSAASSSASTTPNSPPPPKELDVMLPKVCEALVLLTQCIITICLEAEEQQMRLEEGISTFVSFANMKSYFVQKKHQDQGIVEVLIDLLSLLDVFLPRINFGKPVKPDGTPIADPSPSSSGGGDGAGFSYVKRDLVRLLGVLAHGDKAVQDRTREAGGLPVVMNLCVIDERNPYLREHAIFTLHNLLTGNSENKRFVDSVKPSQEWAEDGTLRTRVGAILR